MLGVTLLRGASLPGASCPFRSLVPPHSKALSETWLNCEESTRVEDVQVATAMAKPKILHMLDPRANVSPFDVNMAVDAGYEVVVPYSGTGADDVTGLVQDAIFSRPRPGVTTRPGYSSAGTM